MARTALCLNRTDIAVAAYKEACHEKPDSLMLHRGLAEASLQADLPQEALEIANDVLQMASDNVENLAWYAEFAACLGANQKAVAALERAVQINPQRPDLLVSLAQWQMSDGDLDAARNTLGLVKRMDDIRCANYSAILRRAAQMYLRMEDMNSALACFDSALAVEPTSEPGLYFEVAELHARLGSLETALELAQKAQENTPQGIPVFLLQSDLLAQLNRPQAALAVLEHALRIIQGSEGDVEQLSEEQRNQLGDIHQRFSSLMLQEGNRPAALYHAEKAFELQPKQAGLGYFAADLAFSLLQNDRAGRILAASLPDQGLLPQVYLEQGKDGLELLCLQIEASLTNGREAAAQEWVEGGWALAPNTPRLLAAEARLLTRRGNLVEARKAYDTALQILKKEHSPELESQPLWLAEAALEAHAWKDAVAFLENYTLRHPGEARAQLGLARALVIAAEQQRLCEVLACTNHAPGAQVLSEERQTKFAEAIQVASRLVNVAETARWQARGQAVFTPSSQTARVLAQMPADTDDVAALIATLRLLNNRTAAMQVARRYPHNGKVLLQLALCYLNEDSLEGLAIAEQAVQATPNLALAHAALARLAVDASALNRAIESYGKALEIWPSEPEWHDAAGDLFMQISKVQQAVWHRKQALDLVPNHPQYAYKLGQACLARGDTPAAVEYLERSTVLDAQQPEVWLSLASAYHMSGRLPQAMEAAKQAGLLNPASAEGLLIAGETALAMNQVDQAFELAQNAVRREPENASVLLFLCSVLTMQGKEDQGLAAIESATLSLKQLYPVAFERAKLIHKVHGPQAALETLEKLAKDYPEESGLLGLMAQTQAECGDDKAAERYAFKALRIDPDQPDLTLMLGRLQRKSGQLDQAIHLLGEVIRMSPNNLEAYQEMASVYQERREYIQALQVYRQAMRIAPSDHQAFYQSGLILRDNKDYSAAEAMLRKAAELAPDNLSIRRQLVGVIALNLVHNKPEVSLT
ncbi:MAG: tetratricopeptide repeat protein [Anaerolineaceae bacterium]|nr:tetratricopeptide repeat protein [Anaerolineaceae bacterium]